MTRSTSDLGKQVPLSFYLAPRRKPGVHSLEGFSAIGSGIYLRDTREQCQDTTLPNVILIFGWMGAQLRHLQNYTHAYTKLYPNASQIVVRCNPDVFWTTTGTRQRRLMPVIDALEALHCFPPSSSAQPPPRILTHVFSNGGSLQMTLLGHMLQRKYGSTLIQRFTTSALILDSVPGNCVVIRNPILRVIVLAMIYTMHFHVTQHAETAKERGMDARCELFEESEHVAHIRVEPERYWASVQDIWAAAISKEKVEDQRLLEL
ncbi:hypothetical protein F4604DRAFT_1798866 [Suillus subluteus]|nr:hypothetical protein F4604DRAFT_1798866 [Suillus subluteus]